MVHASMRAVGPIVGGAATMIHALLDRLGPTGTLAAYVDFEKFYEDDEPEIPAFDARIAQAARDHGVLHEMLRIWPGALRSAHPDAGIAAIGGQAEYVVNPHPLQYGYGTGTPLERLYEMDAQILMLGAPLDTISLLHYAEHIANIPDKRVVHYNRRFAHGWESIEEFDTGDPCHDALPINCFELIALDNLCAGNGREGTVGRATCHVFSSRQLIPFAVRWIEERVAKVDNL